MGSKRRQKGVKRRRFGGAFSSWIQPPKSLTPSSKTTSKPAPQPKTSFLFRPPSTSTFSPLSFNPRPPHGYTPVNTCLNKDLIA